MFIYVRLKHAVEFCRAASIFDQKLEYGSETSLGLNIDFLAQSLDFTHQFLLILDNFVALLQVVFLLKCPIYRKRKISLP